MELLTLDDLLVHDLRDLHSAETQIRSALPEMVAAASTPAVGKLIDEYQTEVERHAQELDRIFVSLMESPGGKPCRAIEALLAADRVLIARDADPLVMDSALLGAVSRMQHYKIAAYGIVETQAAIVGNEPVRQCVATALAGEQAADARLRALNWRTNTVAPQE